MADGQHPVGAASVCVMIIVAWDVVEGGCSGARKQNGYWDKTTDITEGCNELFIGSKQINCKGWIS